jgi:hypothetical protein
VRHVPVINIPLLIDAAFDARANERKSSMLVKERIKLKGVQSILRIILFIDRMLVLIQIFSRVT